MTDHKIITIYLFFFAESQCTLCGEPEGEHVFLLNFSKQLGVNTWLKWYTRRIDWKWYPNDEKQRKTFYSVLDTKNELN